MRKFEYMSKVYHDDAALTALGAEGWKVAGILAPGKGSMPPIIMFVRRLPKTKSDVARDVAAKHGVPVEDVPLADCATDAQAPKPDYWSAGKHQREALDDALRIDWERQRADADPHTAAQWWAQEVICLLGRQPT